MAHGIDGIDHAVVAVSDLEAARERFQRLGFAVTPRRRFFDWGTANYSVMFEKDFIELLGVLDASKFITPGLAEYLEVGEGVMAVTMRANEVDRAHAFLVAAGCEPTELQESRIDCEAPDGVLHQRFRWLRIGDKATPTLYLKLVQPLTPGEMRRPAWLDHPNGARAIRHLTVVVNNPEAAVHPYETLFGVAAERESAEDIRVFTGHGWFRFVTQSALHNLYGEWAGSGLRPLPSIAAITLDVKNIKTARDTIEAAGFSTRDSNAGFVVPPDEAAGTYLEFAAD